MGLLRKSDKITLLEYLEFHNKYKLPLLLIPLLPIHFGLCHGNLESFNVKISHQYQASAESTLSVAIQL